MDISVIEFGVYGFVAYASFLMLVISIIKDTPQTKSQALIRSIYMIPGIICAVILAGSGVNITLDSTLDSTNATSYYEVLDTTNGVVTLNSTVTQTESINNYYVLANPIWVTFHYMLALVMLVFIITRILQMLTFKE